MSRRDLIRMTDAEVDEFLHEPGHTLNVASFGPDGNIHLVAMWYGFAPDGTVAFHTYARSQKAKNWERDPRFSALVEDGDRYEELRGAELVGRVELTDDLGEKVAIARSVVSRYQQDPNRPRALDDEALARTVAKRVGVKLHVERVVSWDHRKLGGVY